MKTPVHYGIYKGDEFITVGTAKECASFMGWSLPKQTQYYASPAYRKRSKGDNGLVVIRLEDEEE